jgi:hypothetical protein
LKKAHAAIVLGLVVATTGCAASAVVEHDDAHKQAEQAGQTEQALGIAAVPAAPKDRRVIRTKSRGCRVITGAFGSWNGSALHGSFGTSSAFCTYEWTPSGKNAPSDVAALEAAAMTDTKRKAPYVVTDVRTRNSDVLAGSVTGGGGSFTLGGGGGGGGGGAGSSQTNLTFGVDYTPQSGTFDLTSPTPTDPTGIGGCDVCGEWFGGGYLLFVLPPEALGATSITLETNDGVYDVGPSTEPIFYAPVPLTFSYAGMYISWL